MATDPRRFDEIERVVRDTRLESEDVQSTILSRLASHNHLSLVDAKGDLLVGSADNAVVRLPAGSDNKILVADSTTASGLRWAMPIWNDITWQSFTLFNGWFGNASPDTPLYRAMPDGTIQFVGGLNKGSAPVNGEKCLSVAAGYVPKGQGVFTAHSVLVATGSQKIIIDTSGNGFIYDSPGGNGSAYLSHIRYPGTGLP